LNEAGYVEGRNLAIQYRWGDFQYDRLPALAADLVRRQVAVIFASPLQAALPAKAATAVIPIVFAIGSDPVTFGLVTSFNRPGGNITGVSWLGGPTLDAKRLELLRELIPTAGVIAVLVNSANPAAEAETKELNEAARLLGIHLNIHTISNGRDINAAFESLVKQRADALLLTNDAVFFDRRDQLAVLTARHAIPAIYSQREFAATGGLMSYGTNLTDAYRLAGTYVGRILKGEKPSDLPVQQSTKVELIINMRTAKAIGLAIPPSLFALASEVIE
jgi:putative ABC transport system substrate-binding protein